MTHVQRLVYYSRNAMPGSEPDVVDQVRHILAASRRNNSGADVTGALMFNSGCFAQILEGPRPAVEATFERIQRDTRHANVVVLEYGSVEARAFPSWSMAFVGENRQDREVFGGVGEESGFDPAHITAEAIFQTLLRLVRDEESAAA